MHLHHRQLKGNADDIVKNGNRFTSLKQLASDLTQNWCESDSNWYGGEKKRIRLLSGINLWYSSGEKPLPMCWVLVVDPNQNEA